MARSQYSWKLLSISAAAFWLACAMHVWRLLAGDRSMLTVVGAFCFPIAAALATGAAVALRREARTGSFSNVYDDVRRAEAYDTLEFPGTYYLAYRDLPAIFEEHVDGKRALDFGCGTGRSTRFLNGLGFDTVGVDVAGHMVARASERNPEGDYRVVPDGDLGTCRERSFDLVLSAFTFDNIPTVEKKLVLLRSLRDLLGEGGRIVSLVSSPDIYVNEWASFTTKDYPENRQARTGDTVRIVMLDVPDSRPVEDVVWEHEDYLKLYGDAGLALLATHRPLGSEDEPYEWVSETTIAPWVVYVLARAD
ncbi:methyltransferase domain-containing protein [bacterium]|nr:methyltransferase domain-containing protein [bacterium]